MWPEISEHPTRKFIEVLTGNADSPMFWQTYADSKNLSKDQKKTLSRVIGGTFAEVAIELDALNAAGAAVAVTVNGGGRVAKKISAFRAIWIDKDDGRLDLSAFALQPHIVVHSGHGDHAYWLIESGADAGAWRAGMLRLAAYYRTDRAIATPERVMRVPGFLHSKGEPVRVTAEFYSHPAYTLADVLAAHAVVDARGRPGTDGERHTILKRVAGECVARAASREETAAALYAAEAAFEAGPLEDEEYIPNLIRWTMNRISEETDKWGGEDVTSRLSRDKKGKPLTSVTNAAMVLAYHPAWAGCLAHDTFADRMVWLKPPPGDSIPLGTPLEDGHTFTAAKFLEGIFESKLSPAQVVDALIAAARLRPFHPVKEYLLPLAWDGVKRVGSWLHAYANAEDSAYTRAVGRAWLLSAVARVFQPGCKADCVLQLQGAQGVGKSMLLDTLGGIWFTDDMSAVGTKDASQNLQGVWIVELAELDALSRAEASTIKAFLSRRVDRFRPSYGRVAVERPRQCIFAGTTNVPTSLSDMSGARRFWPVDVGEVDLAALRRDRDQIWAETLAAYRAGEVWHLDKETNALAVEAQDAASMADPWLGTLADWAEIPDSEAKKRGVYLERPVKITVIATSVLGIDPKDLHTGVSRRIAACLRKLGWSSWYQRGALVWAPAAK